MKQEKYIGMDVHQATIAVAVLDSMGKLIMECILETKAATILEFIGGLNGSLSVTFEEGTSAAWLHDLLQPHVSNLIVCDPRKNALLKDGSKSDRIDARKLAELLRGNQLSPVYHGEHGVRTLKELARSYLTISQDLVRVMTRTIPRSCKTMAARPVQPLAIRVVSAPKENRFCSWARLFHKARQVNSGENRQDVPCCQQHNITELNILLPWILLYVLFPPRREINFVSAYRIE